MDAVVEMSGMLEANNYNSVTYSVLGNIYLDALASHHYILSIHVCEVLDSDLYCHDLITFSKILIDIKILQSQKSHKSWNLCSGKTFSHTYLVTCHTLYYGNFMLKVGIFQQ